MGPSSLCAITTWIFSHVNRTRQAWLFGPTDHCGNDAGCIELKRINVSAAFFLSIEFQEWLSGLQGQPGGIQFRRTFEIASFQPDTQEIGRGVIIGQPGAEQLLEMNKQSFFLSFVQRPAFLATNAYHRP